MTESEFADHTEAMRRDGYAILPGSVSDDECEAARRELDRLWPDRESEQLECLFNKARIFERFYQIPIVLRFISAFSGRGCLHEFVTQLHRGAGRG